MNLLRSLRSAYFRALEGVSDDAERLAELVKPAQDEKFGDYQANCAMPLGKQQKRNPREVAEQLKGRLDLNDLIAEPEIAGPGFINMRLRNEWLSQQLESLLADSRLGVAAAQSPRSFVIDFSSPNVAKPMHVGHIRSTIIGDCLTRMLRFLGHTVVSDNHLGDWGTQFGMLLFGYKHLLHDQKFSTHPVDELSRLYRIVSWLSSAAQLRQDQSPWLDFESELRSQSEHDEKLKSLLARFSSTAECVQYVAQESRTETAKLHAGDRENHELWQTFIPHCLEELNRVYRRLGIEFDHTFGESHYNDMLAAVVDSLLEKKIARESEGAIAVFLEEGKPPCLIRKSDGAFLYATTDLATVQYRAENFHPDEMLYVVDHRQSRHFQQFFEIARRWKYPDIQFVHVSFGTILGEDGKPFKTREGGTVALEPLLDEAVKRAREIVDENSPAASDQQRQETAEAVGIAAIKYADLSVNRTSDYKFIWDNMLATQGNTGAYLQYAYARIQSIFRKGDFDPDTLRSGQTTILLNHAAERRLAVQLLRLSESLEEAIEDYRPSILTDYLFNLAESFSTFFHDCPVLKAENEGLKRSRLALCELTARTLKLGLGLLGIDVIERM